MRLTLCRYTNPATRFRQPSTTQCHGGTHACLLHYRRVGNHQIKWIAMWEKFRSACHRIFYTLQQMMRTNTCFSLAPLLLAKLSAMILVSKAKPNCRRLNMDDVSRRRKKIKLKKTPTTRRFNRPSNSDWMAMCLLDLLSLMKDPSRGDSWLPSRQ